MFISKSRNIFLILYITFGIVFIFIRGSFLYSTWIINQNAVRVVKSSSTVNILALKKVIAINTRARFIEAYATYTHNDFLSSERLFTQIVEMSPEKEIAYWWLSRIAYANQDPSKEIKLVRLAGAQTLFRLDCEQKASDANAKQNSSILQAIETCEFALKITESDSNIVNRLANLYNMAGNGEKAAEYYLRAALVETQPDIRFVQIGHAKQIKRDWNGALIAYQQALAINPRLSGPLFEIGMIYYSGLNQPLLAKESFRKALLIDPDNPEFNYWYGKVALDLGEFDQACQSGSRVSELVTSNASYLILWADCLFATHDYTQAQSIYQKALLIEPKNPYLLAQIHKIDLFIQVIK